MTIGSQYDSGILGGRYRSPASCLSLLLTFLGTVESLRQGRSCYRPVLKYKAEAGDSSWHCDNQSPTMGSAQSRSRETHPDHCPLIGCHLPATEGSWRPGRRQQPDPFCFKEATKVNESQDVKGPPAAWPSSLGHLSCIRF